MRKRLHLAAVLAAAVPVTALADDNAAADLPALELTAQLAGAVPLPRAEADLPTITAVEYFKVSDEGLQLECPAFEADGNLVFCEVFGGRLFRLSPEKELTTILAENELRPAGMEVHSDGRLYVAELGDFKDRGSVVSMAPDGSDITPVVTRDDGFLPDDLVFDAAGGFYFTDFKGGSSRPDGGVYYVGPEGGAPVLVLPGLRIANGIGLSPDGKVLWVTEYAGGLLHRVSLADATTVAPFGDVVAYRFTGAGPDSLRIDAEGNVYVSIYSQGRILVFNDLGLPIGQILVPGRDAGHNLRTTATAIRPGTDEMLIFTNDWDGGEGSTIFAVRALAPAAPSFAGN